MISMTPAAANGTDGFNGKNENDVLPFPPILPIPPMTPILLLDTESAEVLKNIKALL